MVNRERSEREVNKVNREMEKLLDELMKPKDFIVHIIDQPLVGMAILLDFRIIFVNQKATEIFEYSIDDVQWWGPHEFIKVLIPRERKMVLTLIEKCMRLKESAFERLQIQCVTKSGKIIWVEFFARTIKKGNKTIFVGFFIDITEQKDAEKKLKDLVKKYKMLFENFPHPLLLMNKKGTILDVNPELLKLTGYSREEVVGKNYYETPAIFQKDLPMLFERLINWVGGHPQPPLEIQ